MNFFKKPFFYKLAALSCAVITYLYIHHEIGIKESEKKSNDASYKLIKLTAKKLPVKVRLATAPMEGYRIIDEKISMFPQQIVVVGPEALLEGASDAETGLIDVSESTKTVTRNVAIQTVAGISLTGEPLDIQVTVPIEKIEMSEGPE